MVHQKVHFATLSLELTYLGCTTILLTDTKVRSEKATTKTKTLNDGGGLQLEVKPTGSKLWRLRCTIGGTRTRLSIGEYPAISLKTARVKRDVLKEQIANGIDPRIKDEPSQVIQSKTFGLNGKYQGLKTSSKYGIMGRKQG